MIDHSISCVILSWASIIFIFVLPWIPWLAALRYRRRDVPAPPIWKIEMMFVHADEYFTRGVKRYVFAMCVFVLSGVIFHVINTQSCT